MLTESSPFQIVSFGGVRCLYIPHREIEALLKRLPEDFTPVVEVLQVLARYVHSLDGNAPPEQAVDETEHYQNGFLVKMAELADLNEFSLDEKLALQLCKRLGDAFSLTEAHRLAQARHSGGAADASAGQLVFEVLDAPDVKLDTEIWDDLAD